MAVISIICPVYNAEATLSRCVESILSQTFEDIELLLINDGSTDGSGAICDRYAQKDKRIAVIHQHNMGVSFTRNHGMSLAKGKYIMFCDSDDYVEPSWCGELHNQIEKYPRHFIGCNHYRVNSRGENEERGDVPYIFTKSYFEIWKYHVSSYVWTKIYDRDLLNRNKIRFKEDMSFAEDVAFNIEYFCVCEGTVILPNCLYFYCDTEGSLMHRRYEDFFPVYSAPFSLRFPLIEEENRGEFCDHFLADFIGMFNYVFERKQLSIFGKLSFNQRILKSTCFQQCLEYATGKNESKIVLRLLKSKNYYLYWAFMRLVELKQKLLKR